MKVNGKELSHILWKIKNVPNHQPELFIQSTWQWQAQDAPLRLATFCWFCWTVWSAPAISAIRLQYWPPCSGPMQPCAGRAWKVMPRKKRYMHCGFGFHWLHQTCTWHHLTSLDKALLRSFSWFKKVPVCMSTHVENNCSHVFFEALPLPHCQMPCLSSRCSRSCAPCRCCQQEAEKWPNT